MTSMPSADERTGPPRPGRAFGVLGRWVFVTVLVAALVAGGWLGRVLHLTTAHDTACESDVDARTELGGARSGEELARVLERYSAQRNGVGLQATVIFADGGTWSGTAGAANHADRCPLTLDHRLYIGSVTKLYTATLVMRHVEDGTIALEDPVDRWVDLPYADRVTVRMLLNHTSGVPNYTDDPWFLARYFMLPGKQWQPEELLDVVRDEPLTAEPGVRHEYSNTNYVLLGTVLENATGRPYRELFRQEVEAELGFSGTSFLDRPAGLVIADGYDESLLPLDRTNLTGFRTSFETGAFTAGAVLTDSQDVASFAHALLTGRIVSDGTLSRMTSFLEVSDEDVPEQSGYGLGLRRLVVDGQEVLGHTGTIPGYSAIIMHNTREGYTIAVLSNLSVIEQTHVYAQLQTVVRDAAGTTDGGGVPEERPR